MNSGDRLGGYSILGLLGRGGMGEVYRARDVALGREVALKILPEAFARDPERLARFQREAQLLASLNHPNIAQIYGIERQHAHGSSPALLMELVEGPTLADRTARGPIPYDDSLAIARQVADALEAAHENGIIHRDLKPANVKVKEDGTVKVLDFGLAKALEPASAPNASAAHAGDVTHSPTMMSPAATVHGMILGTAAYMAPEQARGRTVDRRADIWAFGCVLFEMLTGTRAFQGDDVSDTLAGILRGEPDWTRLPKDVPLATVVTLKRCLEKDPRQRMRDIGDVRMALSGAFDAPALPAARPDGRASRRTMWALAAAGVLVGAVTAGGAVWRLRTPPAINPPLVARFDVDAGPDLQMPLTATTPLAITPDGSRIVFSASQSLSSASRRLYLRPLDQTGTLTIPGIEPSVGSVFLSPDNQWIGFVRQGLGSSTTTLNKVPIAGGTPTMLTSGFSVFSGASWGAQGVIAFSVDSGVAGIRLISDAGGTVRSVTAPSAGVVHISPHFLPDGEWLLYARVPSGQPTTIVAVNSRSGEQKDVIEGEWPRYVETGHLVFAREQAIWAARFDLAALEVRGDPVRVLDGTSPGWLGIARNGTLVHLTGSDSGRVPVWVDRAGAPTRLPIEPADYWLPRLAPDGRRLAVGIGPDLWVIDLERGAKTRVTFGQTSRLFPFTWTADGRDIVFASPGTNRIARVPADGSGKPAVVLEGKLPQWPGDYSPDGVFAYYVNDMSGSQRDVWTLPSGAGGVPTLFVGTPFQELSPRFSPDGRWIAYVSNETGRDEVYVRPHPGPGGRVAVSTEGGTQPVWSRATRELFFRSGRRMMSVTFDGGTTFSAGAPRLLFRDEDYVLEIGGPAGNQHYDAHPDGKRLLMLAGLPTPAEARVVLNWSEELKRLLPSE